MAYNLISDAYAQHQAAAGQGGESAEIAALCDGVAAMLATVLGALPLTPPLVAAYGVQPGKVAGPWPILLVLPAPQGASFVPGNPGEHEPMHQVSGLRRPLYHLQASFLFGAADDDRLAMLAASLPYLYVTDRAIADNRTLDGACKRLDSVAARWGLLATSTSDKRGWFGLHFALTARAQYAWPQLPRG